MTLDLALWKRRLSVDRAAQLVYHDRWRRSIKLFDTTYWDDLKAANPELIEVNYSTTFVTTLVSAIFARTPEWKVEAKRPGRFYEFADTMQILLEQFKDESGLKEWAIRCVVDAITCNIGWIEQGFFPSVEQSLPAPETGQDEPGMMRRMGMLLEQLQGKTAPEAAQEGELVRYPGQFYLRRRSPWDVFVPAGCYEYASLPYLIIRDRLTYGDFLKRPDLKNQEGIASLAMQKSMRKLGQMGPSPYNSAAVFNPKAPTSGIATHDPDRPVEIFTVWDRREDQVFTFSESSEAVHKDPEEWPYFADGFPVKPLQFNYVPEIPDESDNFYGFSDLDPIEAQVMEKSTLRTQQGKISRRAIIKVFVQGGSSTESTLLKMQSPDVEVISVPNLQAMQVSPPISIPPAVLAYEDRIDSDLSRDSGQALYLADASQLGSIDRATVANIAQQSTSFKTSYKVDRIEAWIRAMGIYQIGLYWQYLTADEVGERLGRMPTEREWVALPQNITLAKQWVRNELMLKVTGGSSKPLTVDVLGQDQFMKQVAVIQNADPGLFSQISRQLIAVMMKRANEPALEQIVLSALDPQEQEAAQMENQLMAQGMPQVVGPHDDHMTHIAIHSQSPPNAIVQAHIQAHQVRMQELSGAQKTAGQGVRQSSAAPSAAEIGQTGHAGAMDVQGESMRTSTRSMAQSGA